MHQILSLVIASLTVSYGLSGTLALSIRDVDPYNYTIINGQIFTPGLAIVDAPQPNTPLGGDFLQVALDVSYNGVIGLPPYNKKASAKIFNITMFLFNYDKGNNFTISNGTATSQNASLGDILSQEPGSTVKHVNWIWPDCLVGNGVPHGNDSSTARGVYNISIHQHFLLNGSDYYTIFDLPTQVTNSIPANDSRPSCNSLNNKLLSSKQQNATGPPVVLPYAVPKYSSTATLQRPQLSIPIGFWFVFGAVMVIAM